MSWGPPNQITSDGNGGEILVYAYRQYYRTQYGTVDKWLYRMMYANQQGIIYHWLYRENPNPPERIDVRLLTR